MPIKVKVFDEEHEEDLENEINDFLDNLDPSDYIDVHYSVAAFSTPSGDQVYCYSALLIYRD